MSISLIISMALIAAASEAPRLPGGEPLIGAYFFTRWWEPWRSDDEQVRRDLRLLRELGVNTLFIDHQPSQMYDGEWAGLDRDHRLARQAGMAILPWLESKCGLDAATADRFAEIKRRWGVQLARAERQDGTPAQTLVWQPEFACYLAAYIDDYLTRYSDSGAILRLQRGGKTYRVVSPCVELGWEDVSFDAATNERFRGWLRGQYADIDALNAEWGTAYADFAAVDPRDTTVFDYSELQQPRQPPAVEAHCRFRAELCRDAMAAVCDRLRQRHDDLLFAAELPYEFGYAHPHALGYQWQYAALPAIAAWADILVIRTGGDPGEPSLSLLRDYVARTGCMLILTHRISPAQGPGRGPLDAALIRRFATLSADLNAGLGYYSWNEMVDTHVAPHGPGTDRDPNTAPYRVDPFDSLWLCARIGRINQAYADLMNATK